MKCKRSDLVNLNRMLVDDLVWFRTGTKIYNQICNLTRIRVEWQVDNPVFTLVLTEGEEYLK